MSAPLEREPVDDPEPSFIRLIVRWERVDHHLALTMSCAKVSVY